MRIWNSPTRPPRALLISSLFVLTAAVASCEGEFPAVAGLGEVERASEVIVTPLDQTAVVGETRDFQVEVRNQHGDVMPDAVVAWSSATPGVAAVDGGLAEAIAAGTATIEAISGEARGSASLTVRTRDEDDVTTSTAGGNPGRVTDLRTTGATTRSVQIAFTEVNDGTGKPAYYRVRYARSDSNPSWPDDYTTVSEGACAIPVQGTRVGRTLTCSIPGLASGVRYDFGVIAYRYNSAGSRVFGKSSNIATGATEAPSVGAGSGSDRPLSRPSPRPVPPGRM